MTTQIGKGFYLLQEWKSQVKFREGGTNVIENEKKNREREWQWNKNLS